MLRLVLLIALAPSLASAGELVLPDATEHKPPARSKANRKQLLDCSWRGVWSPPGGWEVAAVGRDVLAWAPDRSAVIVRGSAPQRELARARALAAELAGTALDFSEPGVAKKHKWRSTTTLSATGTRGGEPIEVRITQEWRGFGRDLLWIEIAIGGERADRLAHMARARTGALLLVSHACECGTDCAPPRHR
jgi:hypothetical protein